MQHTSETQESIQDLNVDRAMSAAAGKTEMVALCLNETFPELN